jgi:hypothetical protein
MSIFDKVKQSIKTAQEGAKRMGTTAKDSVKKATESSKQLTKKVTKLNPFKK